MSNVWNQYQLVYLFGDEGESRAVADIERLVALGTVEGGEPGPAWSCPRAWSWAQKRCV